MDVKIILMQNGQEISIIPFDRKNNILPKLNEKIVYETAPSKYISGVVKEVCQSILLDSKKNTMIIRVDCSK